jgi:hypothetical protein
MGSIGGGNGCGKSPTKKEGTKLNSAPVTLQDRILNDFKFHPATPETGPKHDAVRAACLALAKDLLLLCPQGRDLFLSLSALEETMHWANAAVAKANV